MKRTVKEKGKEKEKTIEIDCAKIYYSMMGAEWFDDSTMYEGQIEMKYLIWYDDVLLEGWRRMSMFANHRSTPHPNLDEISDLEQLVWAMVTNVNALLKSIPSSRMISSQTVRTYSVLLELSIPLRLEDWAKENEEVQKQWPRKAHWFRRFDWGWLLLFRWNRHHRSATRSFLVRWFYNDLGENSQRFNFLYRSIVVVHYSNLWKKKKSKGKVWSLIDLPLPTWFFPPISSDFSHKTSLSFAIDWLHSAVQLHFVHMYESKGKISSMEPETSISPFPHSYESFVSSVLILFHRLEEYLLNVFASFVDPQ